MNNDENIGSALKLTSNRIKTSLSQFKDNDNEDYLHALQVLSGEITIYNQERKIIKGKFEIVDKYNTSVIKVFDYSLIGHKLTNKEGQMITIKTDCVSPDLNYELKTKAEIFKSLEKQDVSIKGKCRVDRSWVTSFTNDDFIILLPVVDIDNKNQVCKISYI